MIIYVGKELRGGYIKEVAEKPDVRQEVRFIEPKPHIRELIDEISLVAAEGCRFIIYDVDNFLDEAEIFIEEIMRLKAANGGEPILEVTSLNPTNTVVSVASDYNIKCFVDSNATFSDKKSQLIRCISGYYNANERAELKVIEQVKAEKKKRTTSFKTIGVIGVCHRIGTTTQALQTVKYLQSKGYKACYVEMNNTRYQNTQQSRRYEPELSYTEKVKAILEPQFEDSEAGLVTVNGIDMYYKQERLPDILEKDYDYYVYDYGVYTDRDFNRDAYLKDSVNIVCAGSDVVELDYALVLLQNISYKKAEMIYSFTAEDTREEVAGLMSDFKAADRCYFAEYTPNPFVLVNSNLYERLLGVEQAVNAAEIDPNKPKTAKKGILRKKKG